MSPRSDHPTSAARLRVLYTDLDGTLTGPGGSLFAAADGISLRAAEAVGALHRAGVALVPLTGRTLPQTREVARLLGAPDFVAELGGLTAYRGGKEIVRHYGAFAGGGTPFQAMGASGAAGLLLELFGDLEPHAPWAFADRECTMLFRGRVNAYQATTALAEAGHDWVELRDNGVIAGHGNDAVHAYHLVPRGVSKAAAVVADLAHRGVEPESAAVIGDSPADVEAGAMVGAVYLVANGGWAADGGDGAVVVTDSPYGDGFAEATFHALGTSPMET